MMASASPATKRLIGGGALLLAVLVVVLLGVGASGGDGGGYRVRAIFDTASFVVPGEDVKIAGVKVGAIESLSVTPARKAAIVLRIDDPAFQDFRRDASCTIRLQSLIGEKFVACEPTQPKDANAPQAPPLRRIEHGDGAGQYLLPVTNTSSPVDIDLLNNIMRQPERQRFAIIINELGVGLTGNGERLRAVIRRADPALQQFDRVLKILAAQKRTLADLARDSDAALAPLARERASISDFIDKAGQTAQATAERGDDLEANFARFPAFLRELTPTARRLGELAAAGTPVMADLHAAAPSVDRLFEQLGPFATASIPTFRTLGETADASREALVRAQPVIRDIGGFAKEARPFARTLARGLADLQRQHGIERLLDVILFTLGTANGFDEVSHYLRSALLVPISCLYYTNKQVPSCLPATLNQGGRDQVSARATSAPRQAPPTGPAATTAPAAAQPRPADGAGASAPAAGAQAGLLGYLLGSEPAR